MPRLYTKTDNHKSELIVFQDENFGLAIVMFHIDVIDISRNYRKKHMDKSRSQRLIRSQLHHGKTFELSCTFNDESEKLTTSVQMLERIRNCP